jgi:hypothetical protein
MAEYKSTILMKRKMNFNDDIQNIKRVRKHVEDIKFFQDFDQTCEIILKTFNDNGGVRFYWGELGHEDKENLSVDRTLAVQGYDLCQRFLERGIVLIDTKIVKGFTSKLPGYYVEPKFVSKLCST